MKPKLTTIQGWLLTSAFAIIVLTPDLCFSENVPELSVTTKDGVLSFNVVSSKGDTFKADLHGSGPKVYRSDKMIVLALSNQSQISSKMSNRVLSSMNSPAITSNSGPSNRGNSSSGNSSLFLDQEKSVGSLDSSTDLSRRRSSESTQSPEVYSTVNDIALIGENYSNNQTANSNGGANPGPAQQGEYRGDRAVANQAPEVLILGGNRAVRLPDPVFLEASVIDDRLPNDQLLVGWRFESGPADVVFSNQDTLATHATFSARGDYMIGLTAFDGEFTTYARIHITVEENSNMVMNSPPSANAGNDLILAADFDGSVEVILDGSGSSDPNHSIETYEWWESGNLIARGVAASVAFSVGVHRVTLNVVSSSGMIDSDQKYIKVLPYRANILWVDCNLQNPFFEDGSIANPFASLQGAADRASSGDILFVVGGTCTEVSGVILSLTVGVSLYGSFLSAGNPEANFEAMPTVIDGGDQARTCVVAGDVRDVNFWGFTVSHCGVDSINGGGMLLRNSDASIENSRFISNHASSGAAVYVDGGNLALVNVKFYENHALGSSGANHGGAIFNNGGSTSVTNSIFSGNAAVDEGGAIYNSRGANTQIINSTFSMNGAGNGSAVSVNDSSSMITNSILWDNSDEIHAVGNYTLGVTYSDVFGGFAGVGNLNEDPYFMNPISEPGVEPELHLDFGSVCIDAGIDGSAPLFDLDGQGRPSDGNNDGVSTVDIGAYER